MITKGTITPADVDNEVKRISPTKKAEIKYSINGKLNAHQQNFIKMQLILLDQLTQHLNTIETSISSFSVKFKNQINLLDTIPGIACTSATAIIAEIGIDMSKFKTAEHFCSWAGLAPGDNKSAGKKSTRITRGNTYIKGLIYEYAWSTVRMRNTYLSNYYWKLKQRRGSKKAIIALVTKN